MAGTLFPVIIVLLTILFGSGIEAQTEKIPLGKLFINKLITDQKKFSYKICKKIHIHFYWKNICIESFLLYMKKYVTCTWKNKIIFGGCDEILIKIKV